MTLRVNLDDVWVTCWKILMKEAFADEEVCSTRWLRVESCFSDVLLLCGWITTLRVNKSALRAKSLLRIMPSSASRVNKAFWMLKLCGYYLHCGWRFALRRPSALRILFTLQMKICSVKTFCFADTVYIAGYCLHCGWRFALRRPSTLRILFTLRMKICFAKTIFADTVYIADKNLLCEDFLICGYCLHYGWRLAFSKTFSIVNTISFADDLMLFGWLHS